MARDGRTVKIAWYMCIQDVQSGAELEVLLYTYGLLVISLGGSNIV